jgi:hypothetical protein
LIPVHYVASFCEDRDLLNQWRGYARTNDGYAIGFKSGNLYRRSLTGGPDLAQLIYKRADQVQLFDSFFGAAVRVSADLSRAGKLAVLAAAVGYATMYLYRFKHELFLGEREWRLIGRPKDVAAQEFRTANGHFIPYIALPVECDDIETIVQGPGAYRPGNKEALERFAQSCGFTAGVIESGVPLV